MKSRGLKGVEPLVNVAGHFGAHSPNLFCINLDFQNAFTYLKKMYMIATKPHPFYDIAPRLPLLQLLQKSPLLSSKNAGLLS